MGMINVHTKFRADLNSDTCRNRHSLQKVSLQHATCVITECSMSTHKSCNTSFDSVYCFAADKLPHVANTSCEKRRPATALTVALNSVMGVNLVVLLSLYLLC